MSPLSPSSTEDSPRFIPDGRIDEILSECRGLTSPLSERGSMPSVLLYVDGESHPFRHVGGDLRHALEGIYCRPSAVRVYRNAGKGATIRIEDR